MKNDEDILWTFDGDETSWSAWADSMAQSEASKFMLDVIGPYHSSQENNWAIDIGCGTGRAFSALSDAGYRVIGIDPIINCARFSKERSKKYQLSAYPILASAIHLPIPTESAEFILAISSLFHLNNEEVFSALKEIRRVLLPRGKALLHFLDIADWRHTLAQQIPAEQAPHPAYKAVLTCFCTSEKISDYVLSAGLKLVSLRLYVKESEFGEQRNWLAQCLKS